MLVFLFPGTDRDGVGAVGDNFTRSYRNGLHSKRATETIVALEILFFVVGQRCRKIVALGNRPIMDNVEPC